MFRSMLAATLLSLASSAMAQDEGAAEDGDRRRVGVSAVVGPEIVGDAFGGKATATMFGLDVRVGRQINDLIGVYVPLHLSFGQFKDVASVAGIPALTGTLTATVVADATFVDRVFVGGGGGIGVLNNPTGPCIHLRAGGYPIMTRPDPGDRRKGLAVAGDLRLVYAKGVHATIPMLTVGYEGF